MSTSNKDYNDDDDLARSEPTGKRRQLYAYCITVTFKFTERYWDHAIKIR